VNKVNTESTETQPGPAKGQSAGKAQTIMPTEKGTPTSTGVVRSLVDADRQERIKWLVEDTCHLPGVMAELGVYYGGSARVIAKACPYKTLHLFDTFAGMPEDDVYEKGHRKGDFGGDYGDNLEWAKKILADCMNVEFHVGFFPETTDGLEHVRFSFVHVDADIYQSTKAAIEFFLPRMLEGGIMVFDDYDWKGCPGVTELVDKTFPPEKINKARMQCYIRI
jgi:hypothetical protein